MHAMVRILPSGSPRQSRAGTLQVQVTSSQPIEQAKVRNPPSGSPRQSRAGTQVQVTVTKLCDLTNTVVHELVKQFLSS
eukprot:1888320-Amphidinium_carterae.2